MSRLDCTCRHCADQQKLVPVGAVAAALMEDLDVFDQVWDQLADAGCCDSRGGAEYQRVRSAWIFEGAPEAIGAYIQRHANVGPNAG